GLVVAVDVAVVVVRARGVLAVVVPDPAVAVGVVVVVLVRLVVSVAGIIVAVVSVAGITVVVTVGAVIVLGGVAPDQGVALGNGLGCAVPIQPLVQPQRNGVDRGMELEAGRAADVGGRRVGLRHVGLDNPGGPPRLVAVEAVAVRVAVIGGCRRLVGVVVD